MSGQRDIPPSPVAGVVSISPFRRDFKSNVIVLLAIPYYFCSCPIFFKNVLFYFFNTTRVLIYTLLG